ncbi:MAG: Uma2 family endonuclease [Burkholderiales bacterium]
MGFAKPVARLSIGEYLEWERRQPSKNEYFFGEIFAMVGTSDAHNIVAGNVYALVRNHLKSSPCRVFMSDVKVRPGTAEAYFYPDVFVTCDEQDHQNRIEKAHPILIIEVLSESTGDFDRGEKFAAYRRIPEFKEYVLIDPDRRTIDIFRRSVTGEWVLWDARGKAEVCLESVNLTLPEPEIFGGVPGS